jgi:hypothetical protein
MMGDADRGVVQLRDRPNYQAALLVTVFIIGLFLGLIAGLNMAPEEQTPYYLPSQIPPATE